MTKILLLSDTHGYLDKAMLKYIKQADQVWHAGDIGSLNIVSEIEKIKPFKAVYGNIDDQKIRAIFPLINRFKCESVDVFITHIGGYPGRYEKSIKPLLIKNPPQLFITGHSHILKVMYDKTLNFLHINPGAAGIYGFHKVRTMVRFEINVQKIENMEVIELRHRG